MGKQKPQTRLNHCLKEKARASQRKMGGGATRRPVGLSNHTRTSDRKHSLRPRIRYGRIIPTEIGLPTIRTEAGKQDDANAELGRNLDWADEVRERHPSGWQTINKGHPLITIAKSPDYNTEEDSIKYYKKKALIEQACRVAFFLAWGKLTLSSSFCDVKRSCNLLSAFSQYLRPELPHLPSEEPSHPPPQAAGIQSFLPALCLSNSARRASLSSRAVDKLASASSSLKRNYLHFLR
ncbi:hypothetical protein CK203_098958 [Vitis vinifera]|uniref:Uncharacterized protein n=1 Tax=Vitis vinifera TaxID=29760 RepID=A0A438CV97_VITVI|nr:hypothetical protein CK203_098958 [Vitis vinifera]